MSNAVTSAVINNYNYTQSTPSSTWGIVHNLNLDCPVVDVFVSISGTLEKIIPESVLVDDVNTVTITFTTDYAGVASIV